MPRRWREWLAFIGLMGFTAIVTLLGCLIIRGCASPALPLH